MRLLFLNSYFFLVMLVQQVKSIKRFIYSVINKVYNLEARKRKMKPLKVKFVIVMLKSLAETGFTRVAVRPKDAPSIEQILWDPKVQQYVVFKELRKLKSFTRNIRP